MSVEERFNQYVYPDPNSGCFIWAGCENGRGYGSFGVGSRTDGSDRMETAHRQAWVLANGPIPPGLSVLHKCDVRLCVNPDHLYLGTGKDNNLDMALRKRGTSGPLPRGVHRVRGSRRFEARVFLLGRYYYLGTFGSPLDAGVAAEAAHARLLIEARTAGRLPRD